MLLTPAASGIHEMFMCLQTTDRAQRRLVKNSFIVELHDGQRKLRHLFLFNDVIACAKYKVVSLKRFVLIYYKYITNCF